MTGIRHRVRRAFGGATGTDETSYTTVVTTHNRPALLSRLLDYLEAEKARFPLVILDSSADAARRDNVERIARSPLEIRHLTYPPTLDPYIKVREGLQAVRTAYCSLCADDDVLFLPAVAECLHLLSRRPEVGAAHGVYFNFLEGASFDLSYVVYRGPSLLADDPLVRLHKLFAAYEAVYYAVYRTPILQMVFRRVDELDTVLGRELLTAALTALAGKVVRIEDFYYARSTGDSFPFTNWHPHQIFTRAPGLLFEDYVRLRTILLDHIGANDEARERNRTVIDVIFLRYLQPFLRPAVLDLIITDRLKGMDSQSTAAHLWRIFVGHGRKRHSTDALTDSGHFNPDRFKDGGSPKDYVITRPTRTGRSRTYRVFHEFLFPESRPPAVVSKRDLLELLEHLDAY